MREQERDGYVAVQLGAGIGEGEECWRSRSVALSARPKSNAKAKVVEFRVADDATLDVGAELSADHFVAGQIVDIRGVTQGKGFRRCDEALGFRRYARDPRCFDQPPCAWFDR